MALWSSGVLYNSGAPWLPAAPPSGSPSQRNRQLHPDTHMKRQDYYPSRVAARPEWHTNLELKLPIHAAALPLTTDQVANGVADNRYMAYGLGEWLKNVREHGPAATASLKDLSTGTGGDPFVFTPYNAPALPTLPVGAVAVLPGALDRIIGLVKVIKGLPGYTETIGLDLGIVGPEAPPPPPGGEVPPPRITVTAIPGDTHQRGRIKFFKDGHSNLQFESRRGTGDWEPIGLSDQSPFIDDRPLLVPGQAEVREMRSRFFDHGAPSSDWCDVAKVTISP